MLKLLVFNFDKFSRADPDIFKSGGGGGRTIRNFAAMPSKRTNFTFKKNEIRPKVADHGIIS